jgi:hypothetical protein
MCHRRNVLTLFFCALLIVNVYGIYLATQYDGSVCLHRANWLSLWAALACGATLLMSLYGLFRALNDNYHSWLEDACNYECTNDVICRVAVLHPGYVLYTLVLTALGTEQLVLAVRCVQAPLQGSLLVSYAIVLATQYLCLIAGIAVVCLCMN